MALAELVTQYGVVGLFLGGAVEGEAVAMLGGVLAHRGLVPFWGAVAAVGLGSFLVDQAAFLMGRRFRSHPRVQSVQNSAIGARVLRIFRTRPDSFAFGFRFFYGMRIAAAVIIGTTDYPYARLLVLNALSAAIWATLFVSLGHLSGQAIEGIFKHARAGIHYPVAIALIAVVCSVAALISRRWKRRQLPKVKR